jgi:hypothetical protein
MENDKIPGNLSFLTGNRSFLGGDAESMIKKAMWRENGKMEICK